MTTMTTITTRGSTECSLAVLSTRLGQQDKQLARDRQQINELSQQLCDTTTQLAHISKVLDHLLAGHTPTATLAEVPAVQSISSVSGTAPPGQASSLPPQSTALGEVNPSASTFHFNRQAAPHSHTGFPQPSWDLQEQALSFQDQAHIITLNQSIRPFLPSDFLTQFPLSLGAPTLGHHLAQNQQKHPEATVATGLPGATQHSTMDGTFYSRSGQATLLAMGSLSYHSHMATSAPIMPMDIPTMAKVIPNVPLKLQQKIIQGEFIYLSELLQADFQFKYASIDSSDAFELVHKDKTVLMWPRKKGKQMDCLRTWLSVWALYEQVMVYAYPQKHSELAYYRNFIMQQGKKFIWPTVNMYDIRFCALCTHHSCPLTTMDQALMATILDVTTVMASAHKCFRCGGFNHLVDRCLPQTASIEMAEITKSPSPPHPCNQINGSTMGKRDVITSNWTDAHSPTANEHMSVTTVSRSILLPDVVLVAQSPLYLNNFNKYLANHPDQVWCSKLLQGIENGVNIGFEGEGTWSQTIGSQLWTIQRSSQSVLPMW